MLGKLELQRPRAAGKTEVLRIYRQDGMFPGRAA
jgi:hypothetical protein